MENNNIPGIEPTVAAPVETATPYPADLPVLSTKKKKKKLFKKWWFWLIVIIAGVLIFTTASSSSGSSSSGSSYVPSVSPYVSMVKNATNSNYGITYGKAFDHFFSSTKWSSFTASTGEIVVEFEGRFSYDSSPATAKIQFVLNLSDSTFSAQYLSINDVGQNKLMLATLINKAFESASQYYN